jgi:hypothetical protein
MVNELTPARSIGDHVADAVLDLLGAVPSTSESQSDDPALRARMIAHRAARNAALTAGGLALPPGIVGWVTVLPELVAVWRIQAQMVADIAAVHGAAWTLTREHMLYCLFRHTAAQAVRDLVVRMGERLLVRQVSMTALQKIARRVGVRLTQHAIGKGVARWVPLVGAVGVGAYAYYDTLQVAFTATRLFRKVATAPADPDVPRLLLPPPQRS